MDSIIEYAILHLITLCGDVTIFVTIFSKNSSLPCAQFDAAMYVIGTAGHVDHGKSTLVKALTGIDPDRWEEEQRREMTIDLGFAWLTLPSGRSVSVIDVPGHERFIKNMLAGIGGIDAAILVIAADESIMPQTSEHLAILDLLGIERGLVAVTKADLVDSEWMALVEDEIAEHLAHTTFATAPRVAVSARTSQGIDELRAVLDAVLDATPSRTLKDGVPRMPIDRSFTIAGFGTVVTGTLLDGPLAVGQEVEIMPRRLRGRIRGLQIHKQRGEQATPGRRVAVNLSGIHHTAIVRGDVLTLPDAIEPTDRIDVQLRLIHYATPLKQNATLDLFVGASEVRCRITLLDQEILAPGALGWVQMRLEHPVVVLRGDHYIVRQPSPSITVGGGVIIDSHPLRHRRFRADVAKTLEALARGTPDEVLLQVLGDGLPRERGVLMRAGAMSDAAMHEGLAQLLEKGDVVQLSETLLISAQGWQYLEQQLCNTLQAYHQRYPLRRGMPREELRQRLQLDARQLNAVLSFASQCGVSHSNEIGVWLSEHKLALTREQQHKLDRQLDAIRRMPYSPPAPDLEPELLAWALEQGLLIHIGADIYFLPETYAAMLEWIRETIVAEGGVHIGQFRDRFGSSRKYALAFMEHLDERKITRRSDDVRVLY